MDYARCMRAGLLRDAQHVLNRWVWLEWVLDRKRRRSTAVSALPVVMDAARLGRVALPHYQWLLFFPILFVESLLYSAGYVCFRLMVK